MNKPRPLTNLLSLLLLVVLVVTACGPNGVNPPTSSGFSLAVSPSPTSVEQGETGEVTVSLTRTDGFSEDVVLSVSGIPAEAGISSSFTQAILSGSAATSTLQLATSAFSALQSYSLTITATAGETVKTQPFTLNVVQGAVDVQGRVVVPIQFLPEEMSYDQLFEVTRVWLFDPAGNPITGMTVGESGEYSFKDVPAGEEGYRLIAIFGSGSDAMMMESALAALHPENDIITASITLETTLAAEIARSPELRAAYAEELQAYYQAETGEALEADLLEPGDLYYPAWDYSSVADPFVEGEFTTAATGEVCAWYVPLVNWGVDCKKVPDLVIYSHPTSLEPNKVLFTLPGTEIAKRVTTSNMNVYIEQVGENRFVFSGANGVIGNATGNVIGNATGNVIAAGGYNLIAKQGASVIGAGGGNFTATQGYILKSGETGAFALLNRYSGFGVVQPEARVIGNHTAGLIGQAGSNLIGQAGSNLIGQAGSNLQSRYRVLGGSSPADTADAATAAVAAAITIPYLKPEYLQSPDLPPAPPSGYVITELPFLTIDGVAGNYAYPRGIDDAGRVVGLSGTSDCYHAFLWANGSMTDLYPYKDDNGYCLKSWAVISPGGKIAGTSTTTAENNQALYKNEELLTPVLFDSPDVKESSAYEINDLGDIRGSINNSGNSAIFSTTGAVAYTWIGGIMAINNSRQYAGIISGPPRQGYVHTYSYSNSEPDTSTYVELDDLEVTGLNNQGQVLGKVYDFSGGNHQIVIWQNGNVTKLPALEGAFDHSPVALNDNGDAIGYALIGTAVDYEAHPILWTGAQVIDLGALAAEAGWTLFNVEGINNKGQIVAQGTRTGQTQTVGLVLSPKQAE